jgi:DNA-binding LacI/PurR family transcriptional regulator
MTRAPAMTDVAQVAGVSHQTVSRVLNGHPSVRPATRDRVLAAIERLGYRPNLAARALVTGRSRTLGLVTHDTTLYGPVSTLYGIERAARDAGWYLSVVSVSSLDPRSMRDAFERLALQGVAGVIAITPFAAAGAALRELSASVPVVVAEGDPGGTLSTVTVDQRAGARLATEHLLGLGHRLVAHVSGPLEWYEAAERAAGWRESLAAAGLDAPEVVGGDWTARAGYRAGVQLAGWRELTGVFVANDNMALGVLRALSEHGRHVPDDVSVVGFDDAQESAYFTPPLTTVHQDFAELGRRALELLLARIEPAGGGAPGAGGGTGSGAGVAGGGAAARRGTSRRPAAKRVVIAPHLVVRQSTAPCRLAERAARPKRVVLAAPPRRASEERS